MQRHAYVNNVKCDICNSQYVQYLQIFLLSYKLKILTVYDFQQSIKLNIGVLSVNVHVFKVK